MSEPLKILILEDNQIDAEIIRRLLIKENSSHSFRTMMERDAFIRALEEDIPDVILSDNSMPQFSAAEALTITRQRFSHLPFILVTGTVSEEYAATIIKQGADDYILKDRMARLPAAIDAAIKQQKAQKELTDYKYALDESAIVAITDQKGIIFYANENFCRISKYSFEELIGQDHRIVNSGYHPASYIKNLWVTIANGNVWRGEMRNRARDGTVYWVDTTIIPFLNKDNKPYQYLSIRIDITKKKKAEQKIIESEKDLATIFDNTSEGFVLTDVKGIVKAFNDKAIEIMLDTNERLVNGESIFDLIAPQRRELVKSEFSKTLEGETIQYDKLYDTSENKTRWVNYIFNPVKKGKDVTGVCITGRDITAKKMAEQQKEFDHNNLHALINNTLDLLWSVNRSYQLITANQAFKDLVRYMSGVSPVTGMDVFEMGFPDKMLLRYKSYYDRAFEGEVFTETEHSTEPVEFWSEISFYPIYEKDHIIGTACFSRNITDKKKAEEELKKSFNEKESLAQRMSAILNTLPANIALLDKNGIIVDVNDSWRSSVDDNGFIGNNYGIGENYITISKHKDGQEADDIKVANGIAEILQGGRNDFIFEYACHSRNRQKWFRMIATSITEKEIAGAVVMHIDISEIKKLEEERMKIKDEEQKNITKAMLKAQEKERNAIGVELHDNVNQILVGTNLLLGMIRSANEQQNELINSCIKNIKLAIGENRKIAHELVSPDQDTESLLQQVKRLCENMLEKAGLHTKIMHRNFSEEILTADQKLAVYRIMQEQCTNIIKYADAKSVVVILQTNNNSFQLNIADDGKGMDKDKVSHGIGLRNIASRLKLFNGTITIETEAGKGFVLDIRFPVEMDTNSKI